MKLPKFLKRKKKLKVRIQCMDGSYTDAKAIPVSLDEVNEVAREALK